MKNSQTLKNIFIVSNKLKRLLDRKHSINNISSGQARLLAFLYHNKDEVIYQKDIEKEFQIRGGSVTGILDTLETNNLINRIPSKKDGRKKKIVLTAEGIKIALVSIKTVKAMEDELSNLFTNEEGEFLTNALIKISEWTDEEEVNEKVS